MLRSGFNDNGLGRPAQQCTLARTIREVRIIVLPEEDGSPGVGCPVICNGVYMCVYMCIYRCTSFDTCVLRKCKCFKCLTSDLVLIAPNGPRPAPGVSPSATGPCKTPRPAASLTTKQQTWPRQLGKSNTWCKPCTQIARHIRGKSNFHL